MAKRCYYEILGLTRGASEQDLKSSYRKLAKDCHPDANGGDKGAEQRFKELSEADRKSTRLNSSHVQPSRMPSSA